MLLSTVQVQGLRQTNVLFACSFNLNYVKFTLFNYVNFN